MADAKVVIKAQNDISAGLASAKSDILGFGDAAEKVGNTLKSAFSVLAIAEGLKKLGQAAFDCFKDYAEYQSKIVALKTALDNNVTSFSNATKLIGDMSKISKSSKDDIESLVTELAQLGKSDSQIKAITEASVNLSNVTGKDLRTSFEELNATLTGHSGKVGKLISDIGNMSKAQLESGDAIKYVNDNLSAQSKAIADSSLEQKLKNMNDSWKDLKQSIGEAVAPIFTPLLQGIQNVVDGWNDAYIAQKNCIQMGKKLSDDETKSAIQQNIDIAKKRKAVLEQAILDENAADAKRLVKNGTQHRITIEQYNNKIGDYNTEISQLGADLRGVEEAILAQEKAQGKRTADGLPKITVNGLAGYGRDSGSDDSGDGADSDSVKKAKANYKTVSDLYDSIDLFFKRDKLHPYTESEATKFWDDTKEKIFNVDALDLGPDASKIKDKIWGLVKNVPSFIYAGLEKSALTDSELMSKFAPQDSGSNSLAGYQLNKTQWDLSQKAPTFGQSGITPDGQSNVASDFAQQILNLQQQSQELLDRDSSKGALTDTELSNFFAPITSGPLSNLGYTLDKLDYDLSQMTPTFGQSGVTPDGQSNVTSDFQQQLLNMAEQSLGLMQKDFNNGPTGQREALSTLGAKGATIADQIKELNKSTPTLLQKIDSGINDVVVNIKSSAQSGLLDSITNSGLSSSDISSSLTSMFGELASALEPLTQILFSSNPLMAALLPIIEGAVSILGPAITEVLDPLMNSLKFIGESLGIALLPILDALSPVFALIGNNIINILMPVIQLLSPIIQLIVAAMDILNPILILSAQAFEILMSPVQYLGDLFGWLGEWISVLGTNIGIAIYNLTHWFDQKSYADGVDAFTSDAFTGLADRLAAIGAIGETSLASSATTTSTTTSTSSATYTGANYVTINIYQQAPVVGDGGMEEFARMIRNEFAELDYLNT